MRQTFVGGCRLLSIALAAGLAAGASAQTVKWRSIPEAPVRNAGGGVAGSLAMLPGGTHAVAQLTRPITDDGRVLLGTMGLDVGTPLGDNAFFVTLRAGLDAKGVAASGWVSAVEAIRTQAKMHPAFAAGKRLFNMLERNPAWTGEITEQTRVPVYITFHPDALNVGRHAAVVTKYGGVVVGNMMSINAVVAEVPLAGAAALASEDSVQWIEPALPPFEPTNDQARALSQANDLQASPYNLNGAGVKVLVYDAGNIAPHPDLAGRITIVDISPAPGAILHSTHVAGSVGGNGTINNNFRGMAPAVTFCSAGINISGQTEWLYNNPCDMETEYTNGWAQGSVIATNSIGTNVGTNGFDCTWYGNYGTVAALIDAIVRGDSAVTGNQPLRITWAAGNERQSSRCLGTGGGYGSIGPPSGAKNSMVIGAVNSNDDSMTSFSSWGPTEDGRLRPDFSAAGCQNGGDGGITSCDTGSGYASLCGTSMATPVTAGCVALIMQDYRAQFVGFPDPPNSYFKALLAQSAQDRGNAGPDYQFGYGSIRVRNAVDLMRAGAAASSQVLQGSVRNYLVSVPSGQASVKFTLAWDDSPGSGPVLTGLVNDLDLFVTDPNGVRRYPWNLNPAQPGDPATRTAENHRDNLEQVAVDNPPAGVWTVSIIGANVPQGPQSFGISGSFPLVGAGGTPTMALLPNTLAPSLVAPSTAVHVAVNIILDSETLVPGSVGVTYRSGNGQWATVPLTNESGAVWSGDIPGFLCSGTPQYYFTASGENVGVKTLPSAGAAGPYTTLTGVYVASFADNFEAPNGWTAPQAGDTATAGIWERGQPQATMDISNNPVQPGGGYNSTNCLVTGAASLGCFGCNDVDGPNVGPGVTTVRSPVMNMVGQQDARVSFRKWFYSSSNDDTFQLDVSPDGTNWTTCYTTTSAAASWQFHAFRLGDFLPSPTATTYFRFRATDGPNPFGGGSTCEAAVDDFAIETLTCNDVPSCIADFNHSGGTPDDADVAAFFAAWNAGDQSADVNGSGGTPDDADVSFFFIHWNAGC